MGYPGWDDDRGAIVSNKRINLRLLSSELARREGLSRGMGVAEWSEALGVIGEYLREQDAEDGVRVVHCLVSRAGKRSRHRSGD